MPWDTKSLDEAKICCIYRNGDDLTAKEFYNFLKERYQNKITIVELMSYINSPDSFLPDTHLNAKGNNLAAEIIYKTLKKL